MKFVDKISFQKFEGSTENFIEEIKVGPSMFSVAIGKLKGGKIFSYFWWEEDDRWHVNVVDGSRTGIEKESVWITERNLRNYIQFLEHLGMEKLKIEYKK